MLAAPPGPVAAAYIASTKPFSFIMGPVGSGKTTASVAKMFNIARLQPQSIVDGARKARVCIVRTTYRGLWESLMPSYHKILPQNFGVWKGGRGDPADHWLNFRDPQFGKLHLHVMFRAIQDNSIEDFVRGLEVNAWWLNETDLLPTGCLGDFAQRTDRGFLEERPKDPATGKPVKAFSPIFGDYNAPEEDNWLIARKEERRDCDDFFEQPSGFHPDAENAQNLPEGFYREKAAGMEKWQVARFIEAKIGFSRNGEPVYTCYDPQTHDLGEARADAKLPIVVGVDGGARAAARVTQIDRNEDIVWYDELFTEATQVTDPRNFGKRVAEFLAAHYPHHVDQNNIVFVVDPANMNDGKQQSGPWPTDGGFSWGEVFHMGTGTMGRLVGAMTNDPEIRQGQVRHCLKTFDNGHPRIRITKRCIVARSGLAGKYKLAKQRNAAGEDVYRPVKSHPYSDVQDAGQYATLHFTGVSIDESRESGFSGARNRRGPKRKSAIILPFAA